MLLTNECTCFLVWTSASEDFIFCTIQLLLLHYIRLTAFFRTSWVSQHQKGKPFWIYWSKRWRGGSGISWTICKSFAPRSRQITTPVPHHSVFYRPITLPAPQPTALRNWRQPCKCTFIIALSILTGGHVCLVLSRPLFALKIAPSRVDLDLHLIHGSLAHPSPHAKQHIDRFSQQNDRRCYCVKPHLTSS